MSNSSYLQCLGAGKHKHELYAEYSLPEGWAWLFAPEELHVGHPRDNPVAGPLLAARDYPTTSYLFAEAAVALPRFAARMSRVGYVVSGNGMVAKVHGWLAKHMAKGWWFADTTELEWMSEPGEGLARMRRQLEAAAAATRFSEPSAASLLLTFGWGTGLSVEELARKKERQASKRWQKEQAARDAKAEQAAVITAARAAPVDVATLEGTPYSVRATFAVGEQVAHPVFKTGVVTAVTQTTITVEFPTGPQLLAHQRK